MKKLVPTLNIVCEGTKLVCGEAVDADKLPAGSVESMLRLGQLVTPEDYEASVGDEPSEPGEPQEGNEPDDPPGEALVADLDVSEQIKAALAAANLTTVAELVAFGKENKTLTVIDGIGDASEKQIQAALLK